MNIDEILRYKFPAECSDGRITTLARLDKDGNEELYIDKFEVKDIEIPTIDTLKQWEQDVAVLKANREFNSSIYEKLQEIDLKSIRALRTSDLESLRKHEESAASLRARLRRPL